MTVVIVLTACTDSQSTLRQKIDDLQLSETLNAETRAELARLQESYVAKYPKDSATQSYLENLSFYFLNIDSTQKARTYANQYLESYPESDNANDIRLVIAKSHHKDGAYSTAIEKFEAVQNNALLHVADVRLLLACHKAMLDDSTTKDADVHYFKYAALVEQVEGVQAAIEVYDKFTELYPNSSYGPSVLMLYSDKLERNGQLEEAKKVLQELVDRYPTSPQASSAKAMLEQDLVGLSAEEQLDKILKNNASN